MKQTTLAALVAATIGSQGCVIPQSFPVNIDGIHGEYKIYDRGGEENYCLLVDEHKFIVFDEVCDNHADAISYIVNGFARMPHRRNEFTDQEHVYFDSLLEKAQKMTPYHR